MKELTDKFEDAHDHITSVGKGKQLPSNLLMFQKSRIKIELNILILSEASMTGSENR